MSDSQKRAIVNTYAMRILTLKREIEEAENRKRSIEHELIIKNRQLTELETLHEQIQSR